MATLSTMTNFSNINKKAICDSKSTTIMPKEKRVPSKIKSNVRKAKREILN